MLNGRQPFLIQQVTKIITVLIIVIIHYSTCHKGVKFVKQKKNYVYGNIHRGCLSRGTITSTLPAIKFSDLTKNLNGRSLS